jgi:hypothetical protein
MSEETDTPSGRHPASRRDESQPSEGDLIVAEDGNKNPRGGDIQIAGAVTSSILVTGSGNDITINVPPTDLGLAGVAGDVTLSLLADHIETLSADLSEEKAKHLEEFRELFREGVMEEAYAAVLAMWRSPNWATFSATVRASVLRALATMTLSLKGREGLTEANDFAERARSIKPSRDDFILEVRIAIATEGHAAGLNKLGSPINLDTYNLHLALLLETGDVEKVMESFRNPPTGVEFDAETHRLFALALLTQRDVNGAREHIEQAILERPRRLYNRYQAAMIDYFSALSRLALPSHLVPFPRPVNLSMVRADDLSQQRLARAAEEFERIASVGTRSEQERRRLETWQLACIANLPNRQQDAVELCQKLLMKDPGNSHILSWVLFRRYDLDLTPSRNALENSLQRQVNDDQRLEEVLALIGIYLKYEAHQEALTLLDRERALFAAVDLDLWRYWRSQVLIATGQPERGLEEAASIEDRTRQRPLQTAALCEMANRDGDWQSVVTHLEDSYAQGDEDALLILCDLKAQFREWGYVADRAELYADSIGTANSARLVIAAAWNAKRPAQCLHLLNKYEPWFGNGRLPFELRRLRIHCLVDSDIKQALSDAEALVQEDESVESLMLLMDVRLTKGDLVGLELSARELLSRDDVTPEQFLRAAHLVRLNNPALARKLWLRAAGPAGDSAELTAMAIDLAAKLGLEKERYSLMQRMMEYAERGQGPMRAMNMEQTLKMLREATQQQAQLQQFYAAAEAPIHLLAKDGMAQVFHGLAEWNRNAKSTDRRHLMVRHGGRTLPPIDYQEVTVNWRLHCDVSSILLAHELGVLDKVERQFRPLRISRHTVTALIAQRDKLKPHQKSQVDQSQSLLEMVRLGKAPVLEAEPKAEWLDRLKEAFSTGYPAPPDPSKPNSPTANVAIAPDVTKLPEQLGVDRTAVFAAALGASGFAVTFLPLQCYGAGQTVFLSIPNTLKGTVINCRAIIDALRGADRINETQYQGAVRVLGTEGRSHADVTPLVGATLYLSEGMPEMLIGAEMFDRVCEAFIVRITSSSVRQAEGIIEHYDRLKKIEDWLNQLIARVSEGVDDGTYEFIPIPDERIAQRDEREEAVNQDFTSTLDLFLFAPQEGDVIWLDDRALNKYGWRRENEIAIPLIGIQEVLLALRAQDALDEHDHYDLLLKMRESDFRYLPLEADEVLYHLKRARIENGVLIETEALRSIRRYYSSCMLDKEFLQFARLADGSPNPHSELPFIIQTINHVADAIANVWRDTNTNTETVVARADWILRSLYTGNFGCSSLWPDDIPLSVQSAATVIGFDLCNLVMRGIGMMGNPFLGTDVNQRRNEYFDWLSSRVIDTACASDPETIKSAAAEVRERFGLIKSQIQKSEEQELFARAFAGKFFVDLPEVIAQQIEFDDDMIEWLQLRIGSTASIGGETFHADDYWGAVEEALGTGAATVTSQGSANEYRLVRLSSGDLERGSADEFPKIAVLDRDGHQVGETNDPSLGLLLPGETARRQTILRLRGWFDCGREEFESEADALLADGNPASRMARLYEWRTRSTELYYRNLEESLRRQEDVSWSQLSPNFESLAARMRLPTNLEGASFQDTWEKSARALLEEDELLAVVARFSSLPVVMPQTIIAAVSALRPEDKQQLFHRISSSWTAPIRLLHVLNLALRCFSDGSGLDVARNILTQLFSEQGEQNFVSFKAVLMFINEEIAELEPIKNWSVEIRLAMTWIHACRLHDLMRAVGFSSLDLVSQLEQRQGALRSALLRDCDAWYDCVYPPRLNRTVLLTHGIGVLLGGLEASLLAATKVSDFVRNEALQPLNDVQLFPKLGLLADPKLSRNWLSSFLGIDHYPILSAIIEDEVIQHTAAEYLKRSVQNDLAGLAEAGANPALWQGLAAVTDDLPIYPELGEQCVQALESFDPSGARQQDFRVTAFIFRAAAFQVTHLQHEHLRIRYRDHLVAWLKREVAGVNVPEDEDIPLERRVFSLIEIASILSYVPGDPKKSSSEFTLLLEKMMDVWPDFIEHYSRFLSSEVWDMPVAESEGWWHMTLRLRAAS